ncbi:DUF6879 family protein [Nonomuraea jabiensis]|uniref:DUF6879 domain-containing protein n=1 Tax=Nonomuraea jabiensis TaxID=882448 RepID=A0A7W9G2X3_9ACTN|nr:DUF6879 family protein [Nonomuraea jabiensis]MBB5776240.1 hypothetical protein [Nonomuraea jabiensis]
MALLTPAEFGALWDAFQHTAFKFEVRDRYDVPSEQESLRRFLAGQPDPERAARPWLAKMKAATGEGKRVERVRVVTEPHSDYVRWLLAGAPLNAAAGEDVRYLPRTHAATLELPDHDFAIFDSARLVLLNFDDQDRPLQHELVTDPDMVLRHCQWRDAAWHHAMPYDQYAGR